MEYKIQGQVKIIGEIQVFKNDFTKREIVITTDEKYQQDIKLEVVKDLCHKLDEISVGEEVEVSFNIRGNEYNGKYYVSLQAWKIEVGSSQQASKPNPLDDRIDLDGADFVPF